MEALRAAGRAVLRSPSLARHRLGVSRLRLRQVSAEPWTEMREPLLDGRGFALKYLGMTLVETPRGEDMAAAAVRRIVAMARVGPKKFQKVILTVSSRGLSLQDAETKETIENISIYRISYCTTDKLQNKVFAYVAQNPQNGALECHAFLSPKKKIAQAVTLTVAQAFQVALDLWEAAQAPGRKEAAHGVLLRAPACQPGPPLAAPPSGPTSRKKRRKTRRRKTRRTSRRPLLDGGALPFRSSPAAHFRSVAAWACSPPSSCLPPGAFF